jgi:hypothetical protein
MSDLEALFNKYGSDKARNNYHQLYETLFRQWRDEPIRLCEVGIGTLTPGAPSAMTHFCLPGYRPGGSLRAWRDYFTKGEIYGIDVQEDCMFTEERINTSLANSTKRDEVKSVLGDKSFRIIIDDGLHDPGSQLMTLTNLLPHLEKDGIYVIEDIVPNAFLSTGLQSIRAMFPHCHIFLVGKDSNQMVITYKNA